MARDLYKYTGRSPVKTGDKVEVLVGYEDETWYPAVVKHCLGSQFTCKHKKRERFYFYADKDTTWRKISE